MILIADSGSTKTHWCLVSDNSVDHLFTQGFNPYTQSESYIREAIRLELLSQVKSEISSIYYYGAGCSSDDKIEVIKSALSASFPKSQLHVDHDLLASARALCGNQKGIAAILGTGSNSCLFDGKNIIENIPALGFILGDEGSGSYLGKKLLASFFYKNLPQDLEFSFKKEYASSKEEILESVYKKPNPNRFLASFAPFLSKNISHPFIHDLVFQSFSDFFTSQVMKYENATSYPFNCVGSIGIVFSDVLSEVIQAKGFTKGKIIKSPMEGLLEFHSAKNKS